MRRAQHKGRPLRVLVVDDSAVMRQTMTALLEQSPDMEPTVAADPFVAPFSHSEKW